MTWTGTWTWGVHLHLGMEGPGQRSTFQPCREDMHAVLKLLTIGVLIVKAACTVNKVQEWIWVVSTAGRRGNGAPGRANNQNHHHQQHHLYPNS